MLREVAERRGATWGVCEQIALLGLQYEDGSLYNPRPDVMVLAQPLPGGHISAIPLPEAGVPLFIAEVASDSTVGNDVGDKRLAYASYNSAKRALEFTVAIPRAELRPRDGDGFAGAPIEQRRITRAAPKHE